MSLHRLFFVLALIATLLVAVRTNAPAQQAPTATPVLGILPLDDGTGEGMSAENAAVFATLLKTENLTKTCAVWRHAGRTGWREWWRVDTEHVGEGQALGNWADGARRLDAFGAEGKKSDA